MEEIAPEQSELERGAEQKAGLEWLGVDCWERERTGQGRAGTAWCAGIGPTLGVARCCEGRIVTALT